MYSKITKSAIFLLALFFAGITVRAAASSPDAIAIRVIPNTNHYSAMSWYKEQKFNGSPQSLIVDGYEGVRDGRTVYVNAANIGADNTIYTNIYLISYSQEAEQATKDIFGEILSHWKFNSNFPNPDKCDKTATTDCLIDGDCPSGEYCQSAKAKIIRDTRRLADMSDIKIVLENYKQAHGKYPELASGTYMPGKTVSTWPSWQATLANQLSIGLPNDPINKLGNCLGYNQTTCWNEQEKKFADPSFANNEFNLPSDSRVYVYTAKDEGKSYSLCSVMESGLLTSLAVGACAESEQTAQYFNNPPIITDANLPKTLPSKPYEGFIKATDPDGDPLSWSFTIISCPGWDNLRMENTNLPNQKNIKANNSGGLGTCEIKIKVQDNYAHSVEQDYSITVASCETTCTVANQPNCQTIAPANADPTTGNCCDSGETCYHCKFGYAWNGSSCAQSCAPNGCNGNCPSGCTVAQDSDCACQNGNSCCGIGCNHNNDSDCPASCAENWTCSAWSSCVGAKQTRTCTDSNNCGTTAIKPAEEQFCVSVLINAPGHGNFNYTKGDEINFCAESYGGAAPYTFQWNSDLAGNFLNAQCDKADTSGWSVGAHMITVTATDRDGKTGSASLKININAPGSLMASINYWLTDFATTAFFSSTVSGGALPYTFSWKSDKQGVFGNTQNLANIDVSGWAKGEHTITLTVTDAFNNTVSESFKINIADLVIQNMTPFDGQTIEEKFDLFFNALIQGGVPPYACSWVSDKDGIVGNLCAFHKDNLSVGVHTITLNVTDSNNKTATKISHIQILPLTPISVSINSPSNNSSIQQGSNISFSANYTGGVHPNIFSWSSSKDGILGSNLTFNKNNLSVGSHIITFTASDSKGNSGDSSINLIVTSPAPLAALITSPTNGMSFNQENSIIFEGSASGGVTPYVLYSWTSSKDGNLGTGNKIGKTDLSPGSHTITFQVTDSVGATASTNVNITINAGCSAVNLKNNAKYNNTEVFLISDDNWRDVLSLTPLAVWKDGVIKKYPALIFHNEALSFDADSIIHFLQSYQPSHLTTIGAIPGNLNNLLIAAAPTGAGMNAININNITTADYFSYWNSFDSLVVVDYNDYKTGLMASVLASNKNCPIIFVNVSNLDSYKPIINGKTIYAIGALDAATDSYINANAGCKTAYSLDDLQKWYTISVNSDKMILVNPNDLNIEIVTNFTPAKSAQISHLFGKMSLASPFLAAVREEVIAYTALNDPGANSGCGANANITANINQADHDSASAISDLFMQKPNYLTVIASPQAIPDSQYESCLGGAQYRLPKDFKYGSLNDASKVPLELKSGRIYGITIADASAYIMQSVIFDFLNNKIYAGNYSGLTVAKTTDWNYHNSLAAEIRNKSVASGYNTICYTQNNQPNCITGGQVPPISSYIHKNFILYFDHGAADSWWGVLSSNQIPWLDLSISIGAACSNNNFWQSGSSNFGVNMIRHGSIMFIGSAGIGDGYMLESPSLKPLMQKLTQDSNATLGDLYNLSPYFPPFTFYYYMLGDPVLQPKFKSVAW